MQQYVDVLSERNRVGGPPDGNWSLDFNEFSNIVVHQLLSYQMDSSKEMADKGASVMKTTRMTRSAERSLKPSLD